MKNNRNLKFIICSLLGVGIILAGFYMHMNFKVNSLIPYVTIAAGCGIFGLYSSNLFKNISLKNCDATKKEIQIEENDERNIMIRDKSKAKTYDLMLIEMTALILIFSLMRVKTEAIVMLILVYIGLLIYSLYWNYKLRQ